MVARFFKREQYESKEIEEDCFPCTATSAALLLGLGYWFSSGKALANNPKLSMTYVRSVRGVGFLLIPLGLFRSYQAYEAFVSKPNKMN